MNRSLDFTSDNDGELNTRVLRLLVQLNHTARRRHSLDGLAAHRDATFRYQACLAEIAKRRRARGLEAR